MTRLATLLALTVSVSACGAGVPQGPPPPPPFDPAGDYSVTIDAQGQSIGGAMNIQGTADAYTGSIDTEMGGAALSDIVLTGNEMTFSIPEVGITFMIIFDGDEFTGDFDGAMGSGTIYGVKDPGEE